MESARFRGVSTSIKSISERYDSIEWNEKNVNDLSELYSTASLNMHCLQDDGTLFPVGGKSNSKSIVYLKKKKTLGKRCELVKCLATTTDCSTV